MNLALLRAAFDEADPVKARAAQARIEDDDIIGWEFEGTVQDLAHGLEHVEAEQARKELGEILEELRQLL